MIFINLRFTTNQNNNQINNKQLIIKIFELKKIYKIQILKT